MTPIEHAKHIARHAGNALLHEMCGGQAPEVAIVLGTGWGDALKLEGEKSWPFAKIPNFPEASLQELPGHARKVLYGRLAGKSIIALSGRIHLNEHPADPNIPMMVRMQVQMLLEMGVRKFILCNAAGGLQDCLVGDIVIANGLVTLFAPPMPLFAGEFCSPEDTLSEGMRGVAMESRVLRDKVMLAHYGGYAMVRGPFFEGRKYDKQILRESGAMAVGMSLLPELCVLALYGDAKALCLSFITNSADEIHSHETNQARVKESSALLGAYLERIIEQL